MSEKLDDILNNINTEYLQFIENGKLVLWDFEDRDYIDILADRLDRESIKYTKHKTSIKINLR